MRRKLTIFFEVLLLVAAVSAALFIFKHPDRHDDKTASKNSSKTVSLPQQAGACQRFSLADAKQLIGSDAKAANNPIYESNGSDLYVSSCSYTESPLPGPPTSKKAAELLMRQPRTDKGNISNNNEFGPLKPADSQDVAGYGDAAFWDPDHGQLNILKDNIWYVLSIGLSTPSDRSLDNTKTMADLLSPKL